MLKRFPSKDFSWIDDIFPDEEEEGETEEGERQVEDNPIDRVSLDNVIDIKNINVIET